MFGTVTAPYAGEKMELKLQRLPIERIKPNPAQPRKHFSEESLNELAASIREYGLIQPIVVRRMSDYYELIAGERRLRACTRCGWVEIDAIVQPAFEEDSAFIAIVENLQRENLHFLEEAEGLQNLLGWYSLTQDELARRIGKNQSTVANKLRILKLSPAVKAAMLEARLTERHARALLKLPGEKEQLDTIVVIKKKGLSVKDTEAYIEESAAKGAKKAEERKKPRIIHLFKDYRLFVNTMKNAVRQLRDAGLKAEFNMDESDTEVRINVLIPKK